MIHKNSYAHLEEITINNSLQWVLVRGKNLNAPLLIHVQQGPGLPMIPEAGETERKLHLEDNFMVAYWDQRGCGKSFSESTLPETINLGQMADDLIAVTTHLLAKYNKSKAVIIGYSIGATISLMAAAKDSSIFSVLFAAGVDVDIPFADSYALDLAMNKAVAAGDKKLIKKIDELKGQPIVESRRFQQRAKILTNLGGIRADRNFNQLVLGTVKNVLFSRYYGLGGLVRTMKAMTFCQNALLPELRHLNLFESVKKVFVPVHFIQGDLDVIAPPARGRAYYELLEAPDKSFTVFEKSAHMPQYEEPGKFSSLIQTVVSSMGRDCL